MSYVSTTVVSAVDAASRSGTYRLLARLWLREVDSDLLQDLRRPPMREAFVAAGGVLPPDESRETIENLAASYCKLFLGPANHLPPYQSVWQIGHFQDTPVTSMKELIEVVGYDVDRLPVGIMLDHLAVQLDVMGHILERIASWPSEAGSPAPLWEIADSFFAAHLLWPADLFAVAVSQADDDFYRSVVALTREFLKSEHLQPFVSSPDAEPF